MARFTPLLSLFYLISLLSFAFAAPIDKRALALAYRDLIELSTRQAKMAGNYTLPPLPYAYDVSLTTILFQRPAFWKLYKVLTKQGT